jgi:hypothetical protein
MPRGDRFPHGLPEPPPQIRNKRRVVGPITDRIGVIERHGQTSEALVLAAVRMRGFPADDDRTRAQIRDRPHGIERLSCIISTDEL